MTQLIMIIGHRSKKGLRLAGPLRPNLIQNFPVGLQLRVVMRERRERRGQNDGIRFLTTLQPRKNPTALAHAFNDTDLFKRFDILCNARLRQIQNLYQLTDGQLALAE